MYVFLLQGPAVLCEGFVRLLPDLLKLILLHSLKEPVHVLLARLQLHPLERGGRERGRERGGKEEKEEGEWGRGGKRSKWRCAKVMIYDCQTTLPISP